jgi:HEPN domain-containing protein
MHNPDLATDYLRRAAIRLQALDVLFRGESWADVVRESQEVVELALKALLRISGVDPPRIHDVSEILIAQRDRLPDQLGKEVETLAKISRQLRRDRELAFYGAEDLTPSDFYSKEDAEEALKGASLVVGMVIPYMAPDDRN